jgi:hypothetical protein
MTVSYPPAPPGHGLRLEWGPLSVPDELFDIVFPD